jgi:hypothetical protein
LISISLEYKKMTKSSYIIYALILLKSSYWRYITFFFNSFMLHQKWQTTTRRFSQIWLHDKLKN